MRLPLVLLFVPLGVFAQSREEVLSALRKASEFYLNRVATQGGYHYHYTEDLSYGRSEHSEGPTQVENQREATPMAGMAYLEAWETTGDRFYLDAARTVAMALVKGQQCSGGWDYTIEFDPAKRRRYTYRVDNNCAAAEPSPTTLDDNTTQGCLRLMMRVDRVLGFKDEAIHEAALYALRKLGEAQYPNGAWPQRFSAPAGDPAKFAARQAGYPESWPRKWPGPDYRSEYTFNDNTISDMIDTFLEAARIYGEPRYREVAEKGGDFILLAQMPDPQPAWAQQYDVAMHPAWARVFEPPAVSGGESQGVMKTLLVLYRETGKRMYLDAVPRALAYLKGSVLDPAGHSAEALSKIPKGAPVLARFYELRTNRPLYITKGTRVSVATRPAVNLDGYQIGYTDQSVITHYNLLVSGEQLALLEAEHRRLAAAGPAAIRRPEKLHGLSPWSEYPNSSVRAGQFPPRSSIYGSKGGEALTAASIIAALDARGAWVEMGSIGKPDRVVSVFAARDMVVKIGDESLPLKENQTLEIFQGRERPPERIISTATFARNVSTLLEWLARGR